jgi:nitrogen-specific signal transduction histidine kinase
VLDDRKSKSSATLRARPGLVDAVEALEDAGQVLGGDARPLVRDGEAEGVANVRDADANRRALARILDGVRDEVRIGIADVGDTICLAVSDEGPGIAAKHLPRIFERFYRVDKARARSQGGTGLGLAIVKHIATIHGGRVEVTSQLGQGSTFSLFLPAASEALPAAGIA